MTVQELGPAAEVEAIRAELDELLRARQYAALRERRLAEAVRASAQPPSEPPDELLRQLGQARRLREGLSERCREQHDRLRLLEERDRPAASRRRPTGARFAGAAAPVADAAGAAPQPVLPPTATAPIRGARFSGVRPEAKPEPQPTPRPEPEAEAGTESRPRPTTGAGPAEGPRARRPEELVALAGLISDLHRRGSGTESAALATRAALALAPADVVRLAVRLRTGGPAGAAGFLARATADGRAAHAVNTLAGLREAGLAEEAAELFHLLRAAPATELPELLAALEQAGQSADGQTLLWEWGSAPTTALARLAEQLHAAGRAGDARTLLHQAAGRPVAEVAALAPELAGPLAVALVGEVVALRSATGLGEFGRALTPHPELYGALLAAVARLDESRARTALAALRTAGLPTGPADRGQGRRRSRSR
ncbi:hypothetical protein AB0D08_28695 [Kitasatospora sp. NPDC048540]|uniref:hypothetical protein n=1 Tax=Kitasatospora sp. NPDC048540 TaxID=3155634 RepID=UPI0033F87699